MHTTICHELRDARKAWPDTLGDPCIVSGRGHMKDETRRNALSTRKFYCTIKHNNSSTIGCKRRTGIPLYIEQYFPILLRVFAINYLLPGKWSHDIHITVCILPSTKSRLRSYLARAKGKTILPRTRIGCNDLPGKCRQHIC
jgi:hypothetical protein